MTERFVKANNYNQGIKQNRIEIEFREFVELICSDFRSKANLKLKNIFRDFISHVLANGPVKSTKVESVPDERNKITLCSPQTSFSVDLIRIGFRRSKCQSFKCIHCVPIKKYKSLAFGTVQVKALNVHKNMDDICIGKAGNDEQLILIGGAS
ncbi:hypothetical protein GQX74_002895 [Glossina fuscipes]|nr:hypothetical protein GQX74_002895 [Glossina fuscipes]